MSIIMHNMQTKVVLVYQGLLRASTLRHFVRRRREICSLKNLPGEHVPPQLTITSDVARERACDARIKMMLRRCNHLYHFDENGITGNV